MNPGPIKVGWLNNPHTAIALAGGYKDGASYNIFVAYKNNENQTYRLKKVRSGLKSKQLLNAESTPLTNGSIILVTKSLYTEAINTLNKFTVPLFTIISVDNVLSD